MAVPEYKVYQDIQIVDLYKEGTMLFYICIKAGGGEHADHKIYGQTIEKYVANQLMTSDLTPLTLTDDERKIL